MGFPSSRAQVEGRGRGVFREAQYPGRPGDGAPRNVPWRVPNQTPAGPAVQVDRHSRAPTQNSAMPSGLDGWAWNEIKALPLAWFSGLALLLNMVEISGVWLQGLLEACIAMIPKVDGDSTPLGQRPLCHLKDWVHSWIA